MAFVATSVYARDINGNPIQPGDKIAFAYSGLRSTELLVMTVENVNEAGVILAKEQRTGIIMSVGVSHERALVISAKAA